MYNKELTSCLYSEVLLLWTWKPQICFHGLFWTTQEFETTFISGFQQQNSKVVSFSSIHHFGFLVCNDLYSLTGLLMWLSTLSLVQIQVPIITHFCGCMQVFFVLVVLQFSLSFGGGLFSFIRSLH